MNLQEYNKAVESLEEQRLELSQVELDTPIHVVSEREGDAYLVRHLHDLLRLPVGTLLYVIGEYLLKRDVATWVSTYDRRELSAEQTFERLAFLASDDTPVHYIHMPGHSKNTPDDK